MRDRLDADTSAVLLEYLHAQYGRDLLRLPPESPVWVSCSRRNAGAAITDDTLRNICAAHLETSSAHRLRHTFARGMIKSNAPLTTLSERLGHSDLKTTQKYGRELTQEDNPFSERLTARFGIKPMRRP